MGRSHYNSRIIFACFKYHKVSWNIHSGIRFRLFFQKADISSTDLDIDWNERLGGGTFGDVYCARYHRGTEVIEVAVKTLKAGLSHINATEVRTEMNFLRY